jgi:hypothetical protein
MTVEMVGETTGCTRLGFNLYLCSEKSQTNPSLWNGGFHDVSFLCTKPLIIALLQQDYRTDSKALIECSY